MQSVGVYLGRFNPLHRGHEAVIDRMRAEHTDRCMLIIGSSNVALSDRNPFSSNEREQMIHTIYPDLRIVPLPDYPTDAEWLEKLDTLITNNFPDTSKDQIVFRAGAVEEVSWLVDDRRKIRIIDRFSGQTPVVSATQVRQALAAGESLEGLVNRQLIAFVTTLFATKKHK